MNNGAIDAAFAGLTGTLRISGSYTGTGGFLILGGFDSADRAILEFPQGLSANIAFDTNFGELLVDSAAGVHRDSVGVWQQPDACPVQCPRRRAGLSLSGNVLVEEYRRRICRGDHTRARVRSITAARTFTSPKTPVAQATVTVTRAQAAACFVVGTHIKTRAGEVPVERLAAGDIVHAQFAGTAPVVGRSTPRRLPPSSGAPESLAGAGFRACVWPQGKYAILFCSPITAECSSMTC